MLRNQSTSLSLSWPMAIVSHGSRPVAPASTVTTDTLSETNHQTLNFELLTLLAVKLCLCLPCAISWDGTAARLTLPSTTLHFNLPLKLQPAAKELKWLQWLQCNRISRSAFADNNWQNGACAWLGCPWLDRGWTGGE